MRCVLHTKAGLDVVVTRHGKAALVSGNSLGFEIDSLTREVISVCEGRTADQVVAVLKGQYAEQEIREALGELRSLGAIEVGSLQRFLVYWASVLLGVLRRPLATAFLRSIRGHGDAVLDRPPEGAVKEILLYSLFGDPSGLRIPAQLLRERFPGTHLLVWPFVGARGLRRETQALREAAFDLVVGACSGHERGREVGWTWLVGRLLRSRRRVLYSDAHGFLPHGAATAILSSLGSSLRRCSGFLRGMAVHAYAWGSVLFRPPAAPPGSPRRILVLSPGGIGDILLTTPALRVLRRRHPEAHVACIVPRESEDVLRTCPFVDEVIGSPLRPGNGLWGFLRQIRFARALRSGRFDTAVTLRHWPGQACDGYLPYLAGIPSRVGPSLSDKRAERRLFTNPVPVRGTHQVDTALDVVRGSGADRNPFLGVTEADRQSVDVHLVESGIGSGDLVVGIHPGASAEVKQWPAHRFAEVGDSVAHRWGARVVICGGPGEVRLAWEVARHMTSVPTVVAGNLSLSEAMALIGRCDLFISGDSGPMHIAAALGTAVVAIFGPTDPGRWGPLTTNGLVVRQQVFCGPRSACVSGPHPGCPRGNPVCTESVSAEQVVLAADALLQARATTARSSLQEVV